MRLLTIGKIALALLVLVSVGNLIVDLLPGWLKQGNGGIVIVDSPEVYSRERLINDRFRQVSWLEEELAEAKNKNFGNQAIADLRAMWKLDAAVNIGDGSAAKADNGNGGNTSDDNQNGDKKSSDQLTVSPSEQFSDMLAYREEIRTEMMETLLDDRHDIKGNTLYRLKLDTTVLPEENTSKLVVIQAKLKKAQFCDESGEDENSGNSKKSDVPFPCISIDSIHREWMRLTQVKINEGVDAMVDLIRTKNLPSDTYEKFSNYLLSHIVQTDGDGVDWRDDKLVQAYYTGVRKWQASRKYIPIPGCQGDDVLKNLEKFPKCTRPAYEFYYRTADPKFNHRYTELRKLLFSYYSSRLSDTFQYKEFSDSQLRSCFDKPDPRDQYICVNAFKKCDPCSEKDNIEFSVRLEKIKGRELVHIDARNAEVALIRFAIVNFTVDRYTHINERRIKECESLLSSKGSNFIDKSLSCLAHIEKINCKVEACATKVTELPEGRKKEMGCEKWNEENKDKGDICDVKSNFKKLLDDKENIYSYAITPKESVQRVLTIESERRQKQLALSLVAKLSAGDLKSQSVEGLTNLFADDSSHSEQIKRKPLIVSFGRGQPRNALPGSADSATDFGWILGPKYQTIDKSKAAFRFVQVPAQHSLSAVVSVPSWWTAIDIDIESCWIDQKEMKDQESRGINSFCNDEVVANSHSNNIRYTVRLPGTPSELPRKFGYEIERAPWIERHEDYLADFFVGQKDASLIIKGNELWRSTVVTIGNQKANSIEVLPNMKGIIASFSEIKLPHRKFEVKMMSKSGSRGQEPVCFVRSEVIVWTSEGRTDPPHFIRIHPNPKRDPNLERDVPGVFENCTNGPQFSRQQPPGSKHPTEMSRQAPPAEKAQSSPN